MDRSPEVEHLAVAYDWRSYPAGRQVATRSAPRVRRRLRRGPARRLTASRQFTSWSEITILPGHSRRMPE